MTTIAWDGKTLAADSRITIGDDIYCDNTSKIYLNVGPFAAIAITGEPDECENYMETILQHLSSPKDLWESPKLNEFSLLGVDHSGVAWHINAANSYTLPTPWAIGSGGDFAIAAMDHGKSAVEAVKYAATRSAKTNSKVRKYTIKESK